MRFLKARRLPRTWGWLTIALLGIFCFTDGGTSARETAAQDQRSRAVALQAGPPIVFDGSAVRAPLWTLDASEVRTDSVIVGGGSVFWGDLSGKLSATDERSGKTLWSNQHNGLPAAFTGDTILTVAQQSDGSHVVALDSRTGQARWNVPGTSVSLVRQLAIVTNNLHLDARDARSGALRWSGPWNGYPVHDARLIGRTLLLQTFESGATIVGILYAYNVLDGQPLWTKGNVNSIIGVDGAKRVAVDVTWGPGAYASYQPLTTDTLALADGAGLGSATFAPDSERWNASTEMNVHFAQDAATDGDALLFRIGPTTVYRYAGSSEAPTRYELGEIARVGPDTWLTRLPDGGAGLAQLDPARASLRRLAGLDAIDFTGVYDGLAFVAAHDRAVVFDPLHPADATVWHFACTAVTRAFRAEGMLVVVCSEPTAKLVALALPATAPVLTTPLPLQAQTRRSFNATIVAHQLPQKFVMTRGTAFSADGTLWFCEHALFSGGIAGHTDFIGHLTRGGTIDEFAVPTTDANVVSITRGPDDAMWFTEAGAVKLGRISGDGNITEYSLPAELDRNPDFGLHRAAAPSPAPGITHIPERGRRSVLEKLGGIVAGPDGALWVTATFATAVARFALNGDVRVFPLPSTLRYPGNIARGPDAALWLTTRDAIVRLTPQGDIRSYPVAVSRGLGLTSLVWGPDGNLWFSFFDGRVGRITPQGATRLFPAPIVAAPGGPLIGGCDGALYVADRFRPALWRLTTSGDFIEHDAPFAIHSLARAPDCTLGATESQAPAIGHVGTIVFPR